MASRLNENPKPERVLVSWKEIAAFLNRAERTVKRWEHERGLPVHRVPGGERGSVYAYPSELTDWLRGESNDLAPEDSGDEQAALAAHAVSGPGSVAAEPIATASSVEHPRTIRWVGVLAWVLPVALAGGLVLYLSTSHFGFRVAAVLHREPSNAAKTALASDSVAVLPFVSAGGDTGADYVCDGITESLIGNLARIPQLTIRSRDAVFRLKGKDVDVRQAGTELGVAEVVSGRVTVQGSTIAIRAELTDVRNNAETWGNQYSGKLSDLIQMQKQIAGDVAKELRSTLTAAEKEQITRQGTQDPEAYSLYLKGRYAWNLRDRAKLESAISYFNQAVEKDPGYALAWSGIADAYSVLPNFGGDPHEDFPRSNAAARKALELDPTLARPHAVLGSNLTEEDWNFAAGEAEFRKAIALDPDDAASRQWYAEELSQIGRHREALAEIQRAHELDPLSPVITRVMGGTLLDAGQYDRAIGTCKQLVQEDPTYPVGHDCLYFAYWKTHRYAEAIAENKTESRLTGNPDDLEYAEALDQGFRSGGWHGALERAVAVLEARRTKGYVSPFMIGRLYADMGRTEEAFAWLNQAFEEHDRLLIGLNVSPGLDNLRSDPRFAALIRRVGLPALP